MTLEPVKAVAIKAYRYFPHPESKTLGILRIDTQEGQHWFLVTRKSLKLLSEICAKHAEELEGLQ